MDEYIIHYGVKGMKWGVRKDNYNTTKGPAISTGSKGYDGKKALKKFEDYVRGGHPEAKSNQNSGSNESGDSKKATESLDKAIKTMNAGGKIAKSGSSATKKIANATRPKPKQKDLSDLSDAELQKRVNRMNLERQYNSLTQPEIKTGWDKASDILDVVGDVTMIAVGVATIYKAFKGS